MKKYKLLTVLLLLLLMSCAKTDQPKQEVQVYLDEYNKTYQELYYKWNEGEWKLNTKIVEGDTMTVKLAQNEQEEYARFTGSTENIEKATMYLEQKEQLTDLQIRQLTRILYLAANNPETASDLVKEKIKAGTANRNSVWL